MIVAREDGQLRMITQPDHAWLAAEMVSLFRLPVLVEHPRREALLRAVRQHDNGWRELDAAPPVDPATGAAWDFIALPSGLRRELWERGTLRYRDSDPYVALLTTLHALALNERRAEEDGWPQLLARLAELRDELLATCELSAEEADRDYAWLDLADRLSLGACMGEPVRLERRGYTLTVGPGDSEGVELAIAPFPLAGATRLTVPCRRIAERRYAGDADLAVNLAGARWDALAVRLVGAG